VALGSFACPVTVCLHRLATHAGWICHFILMCFCGEWKERVRGTEDAQCESLSSVLFLDFEHTNQYSVCLRSSDGSDGSLRSVRAINWVTLEGSVRQLRQLISTVLLQVRLVRARRDWVRALGQSTESSSS
jgi:hypothetical protein